MLPCNQWLALDRGEGKTSSNLVASDALNVNQGAMLRDNINRKIFDDHIWLSVGIRKTKSNFTRLQRLSVCLSLLFMTMIANAMWYRTDDANDTAESFQFGPISFTVHQLYTSVMSSLICVPPVLIITILFRKAKAKPGKGGPPVMETTTNGSDCEKAKDANQSRESPYLRNIDSMSSIHDGSSEKDGISTLEVYLMKGESILDDSDTSGV